MKQALFFALFFLSLTATADGFSVSAGVGVDENRSNMIQVSKTFGQTQRWQGHATLWKLDEQYSTTNTVTTTTPNPEECKPPVRTTSTVTNNQRDHRTNGALTVTYSLPVGPINFMVGGGLVSDEDRRIDHKPVAHFAGLFCFNKRVCGGIQHLSSVGKDAGRNWLTASINF